MGIAIEGILVLLLTILSSWTYVEVKEELGHAKNLGLHSEMSCTIEALEWCHMTDVNDPLDYDIGAYVTPTEATQWANFKNDLLQKYQVGTYSPSFRRGIIMEAWLNKFSPGILSGCVWNAATIYGLVKCAAYLVQYTVANVDYHVLEILIECGLKTGLLW